MGSPLHHIAQIAMRDKPEEEVLRYAASCGGADIFDLKTCGYLQEVTSFDIEEIKGQIDKALDARGIPHGEWVLTVLPPEPADTDPWCNKRFSNGVVTFDVYDFKNKLLKP